MEYTKTIVITESEKALLESLFEKLGVDLEGLMEIKNIPYYKSEIEGLKVALKQLQEQLATTQQLFINYSKKVEETVSKSLGGVWEYNEEHEGSE